MNIEPGEKLPPDSTDLEGWRQAIAEGRLYSFRLEALVAAIQDLGPTTDGKVRNALAKRLSDAMIKILRGNVGFNHPNQGEDIIYRVHFELFEALLDPSSKDGKGLRVAFLSRVAFRVKDALAVEYRHSRIPVEAKIKKTGAGKEPNAGKSVETVRIVEAGESPCPANDGDAPDGEETGVRSSNRDLSLLHGVRDFDQQIDVDRLLELVTDERKRLAFYLHMDGVPFESTKGNSIAKAVGKSSKTAEQWVREVQEFLKSEERIQELLTSRMGDRT